MKFKINHKIFAEFDKPAIGVIIAKNINNKTDKSLDTERSRSAHHL